ncbi:response regulator transcription factor [Rubrobacter xylanophilus]|uniref:response regulator transcription factor n=1 Tax=Rubrobacter xylanophilus TaxID=49319 RepID=UPI001C6429BC|nr:response regulator transcription factor [Rubrobacter xylanophilus]
MTEVASNTFIVADRCPMVRRGMVEFLKRMGFVEIAGEVVLPDKALEATSRLRPDVVFIDPIFPHLEGEVWTWGACTALKSLHHAPCVIVYTARNGALDVAAALLAGADGYLHKSLGEEELEESIEQILSGESAWRLVLPPDEETKLLRESIKVLGLSRREQEVLPLILRRLTCREIAEQLHIRPQSAQNHISNILRKLGYSSRSDLYRAWRT